MTAEYDEIGTSYAATRRTDPRIEARIHLALGDARSVLNVGAGTGSYEPTDRDVVAVEPSATMVAQRRDGAAPVVRAVAEALPFPNDSFDATIAILTIHHWVDAVRGLAELTRVARRRVIIETSDVDVWSRFWLVERYFPGIDDLDRARHVPIPQIVASLGAAEVHVVPIPHNCLDGFTGAFWRRPEAYLDPAVRTGMSTFAHLDEEERWAGLRQLADDLQSGEWQERHGELLGLDEIDLGYRLIVGEVG